MAGRMIDESDVLALRMNPIANQFKEWAKTYSYFLCANCSQYNNDKGNPCFSLIGLNGRFFFQHHPRHKSRHLRGCGMPLLFDPSQRAGDLKNTETMPIAPNLKIRPFMSLVEPKSNTPEKPRKHVTLTGEATRHRDPMKPMTAYGLVCSLNHRMGLMEHHPNDPDIPIARYLNALREVVFEADIYYGNSSLSTLLLVAGSQEISSVWLALTRERETIYRYGLVMGVINSNPTFKGPDVVLRLHGFNHPIIISKEHWSEMLDGAKVKSPGQIILKGRAVFVGRVRTDRDGRLVSDDATIVGMTKKWIPVDSHLELQFFTKADAEKRHYSRPLGIDHSISEFHHDAIFHDSVDRSGLPNKISVEVRGMMDDPEYAEKQHKQDLWYKKHPDRVLWFWDTRGPMPPFPPRIASVRLTPLAQSLSARIAKEL